MPKPIKDAAAAPAEGIPQAQETPPAPVPGIPLPAIGGSRTLEELEALALKMAGVPDPPLPAAAGLKE